MKKKICVGILFIILIIQLCLQFWIGSKKEYIHMDEAYSFGLIHYDKLSIVDNEDFYSHWHTKDYYLDYLKVNNNETFNFKPVYENQKNDVHPPFYYLLLRICSFFSIDSFSITTGLMLNSICSIFSTIFVFLIAELILKNRKMALLCSFICSITLASFEMFLFIRMYALTNLLILITTYWHLKQYHKKDLPFSSLLSLFLVSLLGSLTHYYYLIFLLGISIAFLWHAIRTKRIKVIRSYIITLVLAGISSVCIFPFSLSHIFLGYRGNGAIHSIAGLTIPNLLKNMVFFFYLLDKNLFCSFFPIFLVLTISISFLIPKKEKKKSPSKIGLIAFACLFYFILVANCSPYLELRYMLPISSLVMLCFLISFYRMLQKRILKTYAFRATAILFILIISSSLVIPTYLENTYSKYHHIADRIENLHKTPTFYFINKENQRFLDDIYLFSIIDESYLIEYNGDISMELQQELQSKNIENGLLIFCSEGLEKEKILNSIKELTSLSCLSHIQKMNSCDIYYLQP